MSLRIRPDNAPVDTAGIHSSREQRCAAPAPGDFAIGRTPAAGMSEDLIGELLHGSFRRSADGIAPLPHRDGHDGERRVGPGGSKPVGERRFFGRQISPLSGVRMPEWRVPLPSRRPPELGEWHRASATSRRPPRVSPRPGGCRKTAPVCGLESSAGRRAWMELALSPAGAHPSAPERPFENRCAECGSAQRSPVGSNRPRTLGRPKAGRFPPTARPKLLQEAPGSDGVAGT